MALQNLNTNTANIAIQGIKGSFHYEVAKTYFGDDLKYTECSSFDLVVESLLSKTADKAVMAIENSIAGTILPNYTLIDDHNLHIVAEHYLDISMNLMALPNQSIEDITEVASHPIALLQCKDFFKNYASIKLIEDNDTAEVAKRIAERNLHGIAAIGSPEAAKLYGLSILKPNIHTIKDNYTRFLVLDTVASKEASQNNKASLKIVVGHHQGALATALNVISDCQLNLTKIQSIPIVNEPWSYAMFVDVTFKSLSDYKKALKILKLMVKDVKVLGLYKDGLSDGD